LARLIYFWIDHTISAALYNGLENLGLSPVEKIRDLFPGRGLSKIKGQSCGISRVKTQVPHTIRTCTLPRSLLVYTSF
jgi:hypothetical protein